MDDNAFERFLGALLRAGVLASALVIVAGGVAYLVRHGGDTTDFHAFHEDRLTNLRTPQGIVTSALTGSSRAIVQLGLLVLIATPVTRVAVSAIGFCRQRDFVYFALTLFVLGVLLYGLFLESP